MTVARCRWCGRPAAERCRAKGLGAPTEILYCDPETECWERTYQATRRYPERAWTQIGTRTRRPKPAGPDLFDLLPDRETTA